MPTTESFYAIVFRVFVCYLAFLGSFSSFFSMYFSRYFLKVHFIGFFRYFPKVQEFRSMLAMEVEGGAGWSAMALMCKSSTSFGRREDKWGEEDQWLNFRSFLGSFPFYRSRR